MWSHHHMDFCFKKWVQLKRFTTSEKYVVYFTLYKQLRYRNVMSYAYTNGRIRSLYLTTINHIEDISGIRIYNHTIRLFRDKYRTNLLPKKVSLGSTSSQDKKS